jgi:hypothetical protein
LGEAFCVCSRLFYVKMLTEGKEKMTACIRASTRATVDPEHLA